MIIISKECCEMFDRREVQRATAKNMSVKWHAFLFTASQYWHKWVIFFIIAPLSIFPIHTFFNITLIISHLTSNCLCHFHFHFKVELNIVVTKTESIRQSIIKTNDSCVICDNLFKLQKSNNLTQTMSTSSEIISSIN